MRTTLDWNDTSVGDFTFDVDGVTYSANLSLGNLEFREEGFYISGGVLEADYETAFSPAVLTFEQPVRDISFQISDVDRGSWHDAVEIQAFDPEGNSLDVRFPDADDAYLIEGNKITANPGESDEALSVVVDGHVKSIHLAGGPGPDRGNGGYVGFGALSFEASAAPIVETGTDGADTLTGDTGRDTLDGAAGDDLLQGMPGADHLIGGLGRDTMEGGAGNDLYDVDHPDDVVSETETGGIDTIETDLTYVLPDWVENLTLTGSDPRTGTGNGLANTLRGNAADNTLLGLGGSDWLMGTSGGNDTLDGGEGRDTASFGDAAAGLNIDLATGQVMVGAATVTLQNIENISGTGFADVLAGDASDNVIRGLSGDDWILATGGDDFIFGGSGNDMLSFVNAAERVVVDLGAGTAVTRMDPGSFLSHHQLDGIDAVTGTNKADILDAGHLGSGLRGMAGLDWLIGGEGADWFDGGAHRDTLSYVGSRDGVHVSLSAGRGWTGDARWDRIENVENLTGSSRHDILTGDDGRNVLRGLGGNDVLTGKDGADDLFGGIGNDTLDGGAGFDTASYSGARADYTVSHMGDGSVQVSGTDGVDMLLSIEGLIFSDGLFYI